MKIEWLLAEEEPIDPENLLGEIILTEGEATILERNTYVDSWLEALITGVNAVQKGKRVTVEILEEPNPLVFEPLNGGMRLSYQNTVIIIDKIENFIRGLRLAAHDLLMKLDKIAGAERQATP
jgi:hypothetical protein